MTGTARAGGIDLFYDDQGEPDDPALVLIPGLGTQLIFFEDELVQGFMDRAFRVIRIDNRDSGRSTHLEDRPLVLTDVLATLADGRRYDPPYTLSDMAGDVVAVLDHLAVDRAHVLGVSLGGMIAQALAIEHPHRVQSLSLLSSTTGAADVGQPTPEALAALLAPPVVGGRDAVVDANVTTRRIWATADHFDETWTREYFERAYDRQGGRDGSVRQLAAVLCAPDREPDLAQLAVPTLVLHGTHDPLIAPDGGARLAALVPDATLVELEGMGHDLPPNYWSPVIEAVTQLAIRALG